LILAITNYSKFRQGVLPTNNYFQDLLFPTRICLKNHGKIAFVLYYAEIDAYADNGIKINREEPEMNEERYYAIRLLWVHDPEGFAEYQEMAKPILARH
jgi:hypothetical protein